MATELEAKFKVDGFVAVEAALIAAGADFLSGVLQRDVFFDTPDRQLKKSGRGLRLRELTVLESGSRPEPQRFLLTYKGPRQDRNGLKIREEIQTPLEDGAAMTEILLGAGWRVFMRIEKRRRSFRLGQAEIELDELPMLGGFVEIEAPSETLLHEVRRKIGLPDEPISESYLHLLSDHCEKIKRECVEVSFENCSDCPAQGQ